VKRLIFIVFIFLLFIFMSVRSYNPAYTEPPSSLKSIMQLKRTTGMKLPHNTASPEDDAPVRIQGYSGTAPDQSQALSY